MRNVTGHCIIDMCQKSKLQSCRVRVFVNKTRVNFLHEKDSYFPGGTIMLRKKYLE